MHPINLEDINYTLPTELIAQTPSEKRDQSRLLVLNPKTQTITHHLFSEISDLLRPTDVLVINDTQVIKARLLGTRQTGGQIECFLVEPTTDIWVWKVMLSHSKRIREKELISIGPDCQFQVLQKYIDDRTHLVKFIVNTNLSEKHDPFFKMVNQYGKTPLPPYIQDPQSENETLWAERYQTVFAKTPGAVAAPTAGLHFTEPLMAQLRTNGIQVAPLTLHVGLGTFLPIQTDTIQTHKMHAEWFSVSDQTAKILNQARTSHHRIIAVGTTVARTLETVFQDGRYQASSGSTDIFIYPGHKIQSFQGLITNFHLPKSTLLLLVMAFAGKDFIQTAYQTAIAEKYRFFSFGDAMLIA